MTNCIVSGVKSYDNLYSIQEKNAGADNRVVTSVGRLGCPGGSDEEAGAGDRAAL